MTLAINSPTAWSATAPSFANANTSDGPISSTLLALLETMNAAAPFSRATTILDVGTGAGIAIVSLFRRFGVSLPSSCIVLATDFASGMVDAVRNKKNAEVTAGNLIWSKVTPAIMDAQDLSDIESATVSHYMSNHCIFFLPEPRKAILEAFRVILPGGIIATSSVITSEWMEIVLKARERVRPMLPGFRIVAEGWDSEEGIRKEHELAGFTDVEVKEVPMQISVANVRGFVDGFVINGNNPGFVMFKEGLTNDEILRMGDELEKLILDKCPNEPRALNGITLVVVGKKK
ncbi:S-adenosyl-L-methionine-dependent methyltransferase [Cladochytrium replicatum]|nr:S-adenosyl-L-methionine-dependent methyltransferase [Cladochytrium replicatum]